MRIFIQFLFCFCFVVCSEDGFLITSWVGDVGCYSPHYHKQEFFNVDQSHYCFMVPGSNRILSSYTATTQLYTGKTIKVFEVTSYPTIKSCREKNSKKAKILHKFYLDDKRVCKYNEEKKLTFEGRIVSSDHFLDQSSLEDNDFMHHVYDGGPTCSKTRYILLEKKQADNHLECPSTGDCVYHASISQSERKICFFPKGDGDEEEEEQKVENLKEIPEAAISKPPKKNKERKQEGQIILLIALIGIGVVVLIIGSLCLCFLISVFVMLTKNRMKRMIVFILDEVITN